MKDYCDHQEHKRSSSSSLQESEVKLRRKERVPKCCVVGDGGTGKTSMMMRYTLGKILSDYQPTCFENYTIDVRDGEDTHQLCVLDTAGQETYDRLRTLAYSDTDVFVVCFSVYDSDSFENVKQKWIPEIKQFKPDTPFFIVGTHTDLRHSVVDITDDCISTAKGKKCAKKWGAMKYLECSSIDGSGLDEVFQLAYSAAVSPKKKRQTWKSFKDAFKRRTMKF
ncbi:uncharacterized protein LOC133183367 [Saccostrea echinata]|uniref:uncharacterized protein LOC133183367 n=1 Tax=Saccostrea echinata TaxID=191078 RepID=UPI002A81308A|nr:uncharacterized protein LOC133183367 [Saccostrea echinata]